MEKTLKSPLADIGHTSDNELLIRLREGWNVHQADEIRRLLKDVKPGNTRRVIIDGSGLVHMDLSAAWTLSDFMRKLGASKADVVTRGFNASQQKIFEMLGHIEHPPSPKKTDGGTINAQFVKLGKSASVLFKEILNLETLFGQICIGMWRVLLNPARLRLRSVVYHINEICIRAIPIVSLMAFLISIVLGYQGSVQLERFGANIFTVNLVSISLLREMGVIITAILVAGRSGSAFAAQIGVMRINQETDAMRTFGLDPFELLILPRIIAIIIALPLLTFIADLVGLFGTWFVSVSILKLTFAEFMGRVHQAVWAQTFLVGLMKAPVFGLLIGMVGCLQGMEVRESAEEVGQRTTSAVVQAIFLVVLADALFSILFTWIGI